MNLLFNDEAVLNFDTNFKVKPPLRSAADQKALLKGFLEGTIDTIDSDHRPKDIDEKDIEFSNAAFGGIQIQTVFPSFNTSFSALEYAAPFPTITSGLDALFRISAAL